MRDTLSEGTWYSGAARWTAAQALRDHSVWVQASDTLVAVSFPAEKAFRIEALQQFEAKQSLEFIRIYSKYMQVA